MERGQELVGGGHQEGAERERGLALRPRHARQPGRRRGAARHTALADTTARRLRLEAGAPYQALYLALLLLGKLKYQQLR